jgi:hypothetical protein
MWDVTLFLLIIYQAICLPMRIAFEFQANDFLFYFEFLVDLSFILDILLNFNTGFYQKGVLIMRRELIVKDYMKNWFWVDLVSSIPYTWLLAASQGVSIRDIEDDDAVSGEIANAPQLLKLLKVAKLLKMLKLLRVVKIKRILLKFEEYIVTDSMDLMVTFLNITVKIIVVAHYMGCAVFYIGLDEVRAEGRGWVFSKEMVDEDFSTQYITSLYWAFTTMSAVGYGDISPVTKNEMAVVMGMMIASCGMFAYTVNSIGNIVSQYNQLASTYRERMLYVNQFMISKEIPTELRVKIRRYLEYVFESMKEVKVEENEVAQLLNESLRDKINMHLRGRILQSIYFLEEFGLDFLSDLAQYFKKMTYITGDYLFMEKDKARSIFYIIQGRVAMIHKQSHTFITDLLKEQYVGELGFLQGGQRCLSAKARDFTEVFII